jgi:hypothetical protein
MELQLLLLLLLQVQRHERTATMSACHFFSLRTMVQHKMPTGSLPIQPCCPSPSSEMQ